MISRDFPSTEPSVVRRILEEYGKHSAESGGERVHLAALKLAGGELDQLREHIAIARRDARDVLAAAEYPLATKDWPVVEKMSQEERQQIYDADWKQYQDWLLRA